MKRKYRRLIYIIFVVLFLISIPFILLYTGGYRYNLKKNKFEKTGNLLFTIETKNVTVSVDDKTYNGKDELRIKNIVPGEYLITLAKEGFFSWQKRLTIQSTLTTFINNARLFKNDKPATLVNEPIEKIYPSLEKNKLIYTQFNPSNNRSYISLLNTEREETKLILDLSGRISEINWSPDGNKILIKTPGGFRLFDLQEEEINLPFLKNKINTLRWDERNSSQLFAETKEGIYRLDLLFKTTLKIYPLSRDINDFIISEGHLYILEGYSLKQINLNDNIITYIPLERKDYKIETIIDKKLYLTSARNKLQIFDLPLHTYSTPIMLVTAKDFDVFKNNLLYYNDFELWTYDFGSGNKELVTRIGSTIKKVHWLNGTEYLIFIVENQIKIIEIDKRDKRQIIELVNAESISDLMLTKKYILYFAGRLDKTSGLFQLEI